MSQRWQPSLGAILADDQTCEFRVWSPGAKSVMLHLCDETDRGADRYITMQRDSRGYHSVCLPEIQAGQRYLYYIDKRDYPDPASRSQPKGVGMSGGGSPSVVVERHYDWRARGWRGLPLRDYILYELHIGTFTPQGTFEAAIGQLDRLVSLGITAVELMPVTQFPGHRNWGYDVIFPFAVQHTYGGAKGLKAFVDACHLRGLAVVLDVVYNHFGEEGAFIHEIAPYHSQHYNTPWGASMNLDEAHSDEVRHFFIENALMWFDEFQIDGLRLDAVHFLVDMSGRPFLRQLSEQVQQHAAYVGRPLTLIAEAANNDANLVRPPENGGMGLDALWSDDFHHALYTVLKPDSRRYQTDYGGLPQLCKALCGGFVYDGEYAPKRQKHLGAPTDGLSASHFVVFIQNHDQIGNRMPNERLMRLLPLEALVLATGFVLLSPYIPLLFMGEEYGETAPFEFFTDYSDSRLIEKMNAQRQRDFGHGDFEPPDPQFPETFRHSRLNPDLRHHGKHRILYECHKTLIQLRKRIPALHLADHDGLEVRCIEEKKLILMRRWVAGEGKTPGSEVLTVFYFGDTPQDTLIPLPKGCWREAFHSGNARWLLQGAGDGHLFKITGDYRQTLPPYACLVYVRETQVH